MIEETQCSARQLVEQIIVQNTVHGMNDIKTVTMFVY
jgi:hypothetical protein